MKAHTHTFYSLTSSCVAPRLKSAMTKSIYFTISEICYRPLFLPLSLWSSPLHAYCSWLWPAASIQEVLEARRGQARCHVLSTLQHKAICAPASAFCWAMTALPLKYNVLHDYWKGSQDKEWNDTRKEREKHKTKRCGRHTEGKIDIKKNHILCARLYQ